MDEESRLSKLRSELKYLEGYERQLREEYISFRKRGLFYFFKKVNNSSITLGMMGIRYKYTYLITCIISCTFPLCVLWKVSSVILPWVKDFGKLPILLSPGEVVICSCSVIVTFIFLLFSELYKYKYISSIQEEISIIVFDIHNVKHKIKKLLINCPLLSYEIQSVS